MIRPILLLTLAAAMATATMSCRKRDGAASDETRDREKELDLFVNAIDTVQDRYVDVDRVQMNHLMSNSLRGMVESIDPYGRVMYTTNEAAESGADEVDAIEIKGPDEAGIAIIHIYGFNDRLKRQLRKLESAWEDRTVNGVLVDARGAHGEDYEAAVVLAEWFLPRNSLVGTSIEKQGSAQEPLITRRIAVLPTNTLVVLTDRHMSGPGEIFAAAIRHYQRGTLVGEPTRGATVIQSTLRVTDEWSVRLSTGRVLDPSGNNIIGRPLIPDIEAKPVTGEDENIDWIFNRGIAVLLDQTSLIGAPP